MNGLRSLAILMAVFGAGGCRFTPTVPAQTGVHHEHADAASSEEIRSTIWVSYQIEIVAIDGETTNYGPGDAGLYYQLSLTPGPHTLTLRLRYRSPTQYLSSTPIDLEVQLGPAKDYRLLDLGAARKVDRRFTPRLLPGSPTPP